MVTKLNYFYMYTVIQNGSIRPKHLNHSNLMAYLTLHKSQ